MKFSLTEKGRTRINTTFHVVDSAGTTVGSINIPHGQEADLQNVGAIPFPPPPLLLPVNKPARPTRWPRPLSAVRGYHGREF
jgi:hypothetical protein